MLRFLRRLRTRPPSGHSVELKPLEQIVLRVLLAGSAVTAADVRAIIEARRPILAPTVDEVLTPLLDQGLAEARFDLKGPAVYVATAKARPLKSRLPEDPRTVTEFWL